jgi:hypothetical protein
MGIEQKYMKYLNSMPFKSWIRVIWLIGALTLAFNFGCIAVANTLWATPVMVIQVLLIFSFLFLLKENDPGIKQAPDELFFAYSIFAAWVTLRHICAPELNLLNPRTVVWTLLPLWFFCLRSLSDKEVRLASLAMLGIFPITSIYYPANINAQAWCVMGLLSLAALNKPRFLAAGLLFLTLATGFIYTTRSAFVAGGAAILFLVSRRPLLTIFGAVAGLTVALFADILVAHKELFHYRNYLAENALQGFMQSPIAGVGWGSVWHLSQAKAGAIMPYAHCFPLTILAETGIIGIILAAAVVAAVFRRLPKLYLSAQALVILLGVWSFFDEPLNGLDGALLLILALTRIKPAQLHPEIP